MKPDTLGMFVPANETLYVMMETKWSVGALAIDRLKKILLQRELIPLNTINMSGVGDKAKDLSKIMPRPMTVKDATARGYKIIEIPLSEPEARLAAKKEKGEKDEPATGLFGRKS